MFAGEPAILNLALPPETSAVNVAKSFPPVSVETNDSEIVASVPAEFTVKVISEF